VEVIAQLRALTEGNDIHGRLGAVALARVVDPLVDDATRPAWTKWLVARFGDAFAYDINAAEKPGLDELVQALLAFVPAESFSKASRAYVNLDRNLANAFGPLPSWIAALAAIEGGDKLFERIRTRAQILRDPESRESWLAALGEFGPAQLPKALALVTTGDLDPVAAWPAVVRYLARGTTRAAAWRLVRDKLPTIMRRMGNEVGLVIDATAHLCDPATRTEVAAAFAEPAKTIASGPLRLSRALESIDACLERRAKLGDIGAAL
jgi:hypothetical protein